MNDFIDILIREVVAQLIGDELKIFGSQVLLLLEVDEVPETASTIFVEWVSLYI
jgi:hypothetical protein